jgi:creatinine amidohydrolase
MTLFPARNDWDEARRAGGLITTGHEDMHGGELEVSILLHAYPELVGEGVDMTDHEAPSRPHLTRTRHAGLHRERHHRPTIACHS